MERRVEGQLQRRAVGTCLLSILVLVTIVGPGCFGGPAVPAMAALSGIETGGAVAVTSTQAATSMETVEPAASVVESSHCDYTVSPDGQDGNPGTLTLPFRTIAHAQEIVRLYNGSMQKDLVVCLRGGKYQLVQPLLFDSRDSGTNGHSVVYQAYAGESVSITGGQRIVDWSPVNAEIYRALVGPVQFRQLFVGGRRAIRAREPDDGYFRLVSWDMEGRRIKVLASDIAQLGPSQAAELHVQKSWNQDILRVASIGVSGGYAYVTPQEPERRLSFNGNPPESDGQPFHLENALELLDQPGEWYLDAQTRYLYYYPRSDENMATATVVAPALETLVSISGTPTALVGGLTFRGLTLEHTTWTRPNDNGFVGRQAGWFRWATIPGAVQVEFASNLTFERNTFQHLGGSGLVLFQGTRDTAIVGNVVRDVSGNGICVEMRAENHATEAEQCKRDVVRNNYITAIGQDYLGSVAVFAGYPDSAIIEHNEIHSTPYTGISVGWGWTLDPTALRNNRIAHNNVYDVLTALADGGGIYTLSSQPGTQIFENYVHDVQRSQWAADLPIAGIYLDNGSDYITVEGNVIVDVPKRVHVNAYPPLLGTHNTIRNNDGYVQAVVDHAGLQPEYQDIKGTAEADRTITAHAFEAAPAIDGDLAEWYALPAVRLDAATADHVEPRQVPDPADASAVLRAGWDGDHLYFALELHDDVLVSDSAEIWRDDSIEIGIDGLQDHVGWAADDHQFTFSLDGRVTDFGAPTVMATAVTRTVSGGWVLELSLDGAALGGGPLVPGRSVGITFGLHDDDDGGDWESYLIWEGQSTNDSSDEYGSLYLEAPAPTPTPTSTPAPTLTNTPTPTRTPTATGTPTPTRIPRTITSYRMRSPPTVDGDLDDWAELGTVTLDATTAAHVNPRYWPSPSDSSATLRSSWDDQMVYFAIRVTDDILVADSDKIWWDDGVELGIDGAHDGREHGPGDDHQFTVAVDGRLTDYGWMFPQGVLMGLREAPGGFTIEVSVPVDQLGEAPLESGRVLGFTWGLHDDDDGGAWESYLIWEGTSTFDPSMGWGRLALALTPGSIGGTTWHDSDADGLRDLGERPVSGVDVTLGLSGDDAIRTAKTDLNGTYRFDGLLPGLYSVTASKPDRYRFTTSDHVIRQLQSGEADLSAGFGLIAVTVVRLVSFEARVVPDGVLVAWSSLCEPTASGYQVQRSLSHSGPWRDVIDGLVPSQSMAAGICSYQVMDSSVEAGSTYFYRLLTLPDGQRFGPISIRVP